MPPTAAHRACNAWPRTAALVAGLLVACTAAAQPRQALDAINRLRAPGGGCRVQAPPLQPQASLDAAAGELARGRTIEAALKNAGYRATRAQVLRVGGPALRLQLESYLARNHCAQVAAAELTQLGVHIDGDQWWLLLAAPFAPHVALSPRQLAEGMLTLVNAARAEARRCGDKAFPAAAPLSWNTALARAALAHATDMARNDYFSHTGRDGSTPAQRVQRAGFRFRATGENIAAGNLDLQAAVAGWLQSPGHCATLMQDRFTEMGAAFAGDAKSRMGIYWVQSFGTPP